MPPLAPTAPNFEIGQKPLAQKILNHMTSREFFAAPKFKYMMQHKFFMFMATLDLIFTAIIIWRMGGGEANPLADAIIQHHGIYGMTLYKYSMVALIVIMTEAIGRVKSDRGLFLAWAAGGLTALPVCLSLYYFMDYFLSGF